MCGDGIVGATGKGKKHSKGLLKVRYKKCLNSRGAKKIEKDPVKRQGVGGTSRTDQ